ncbi:MAG: Dam family site-specific DNA-(adenine-N6)-methyltransferase [Dehalococcoidia bacterium]
MQALRAPLRPPLKWAGGKRWLLPRLLSLWEPYRDRRLVEPFCGGLAVALGLRPKRALLNDINEHVVQFYRSLQAGLQIEINMANERQVYDDHRVRFNELLREGEGQTVEASSLFYYLNRTGYNGLCRFNSRGEFNVPFGKHRSVAYQDQFQEYRPTMRRWRFTCGDFAQVKLRDDDFVYADPPYDVQFTQYSAKGFDWQDQVRLAEQLAQHPGPVVLSNQATPRIVELYEQLGYQLLFLQAPRMISCNGDRSSAREVVATRGIPERLLRDL